MSSTFWSRSTSSRRASSSNAASTTSERKRLCKKPSHRSTPNSPTDNGTIVMREMRRRTPVVGAFPGGNSALMLVSARPRHVAATKGDTKRYMQLGWPKSEPSPESLTNKLSCLPGGWKVRKSRTLQKTWLLPVARQLTYTRPYHDGTVIV
jgi:hypothetical protein